MSGDGLEVMVKFIRQIQGRYAKIFGDRFLVQASIFPDLSFKLTLHGLYPTTNDSAVVEFYDNSDLVETTGFGLTEANDSFIDRAAQKPGYIL